MAPANAPKPKDEAPKDEAPKAAPRRLVANVALGGKWYGPSYPDAIVTDEIAAQITNPDAWE